MRILKHSTEASTELGTQAHAPRSLPRSHFIIPQKLKLRLSAKSVTEKLKPRLLGAKDPEKGDFETISSQILHFLTTKEN